MREESEGVVKIITSYDLVDYSAEPCPYCNEHTLYIEFDEYEVDGTPTEAGTHIHCKNERDADPHDHSDMPYVNWLPVNMRAYRWCLANIRIADVDDRKRLTDWSEGKPLRGGL